MSDTSTNHRLDLWTAIGSWLVVLIPLFSFPLIWTHPTWFKRFPYHFEFPWSGVALVAVIAAASVAVIRSQRPAGDADPDGIQLGTRSLLLMMALVVVSWVVAVVASDHPFYSTSLIPSWLGFLALFWIGAQLPGRSLPRLCHIWFYTVIVVVIFGLARLITVPDFAATFGNRNFLAAFLVTGLLLGFAMISRQVAARQRGKAWATGLGCLLIVVGLRLCGSRGAWLGLLAVGCVWVVWLTPVWRNRRLIKLLIVVLTGLAGFLVARPYIAKVWATDVRPPIWEGTIQMIMAKPILGFGLGRYDMCLYEYLPPEQYERPCGTPTIQHAHNHVLELAAEQGLVGLAVMMGFWVFCFWRIGRFIEPQAQAQGKGAGQPEGSRRPRRTGVSECNHREHREPKTDRLAGTQTDAAKRSAWPTMGFADERIYRLAVAAGVFAFLVHNLVDVNSRLAPMQAFGWLMLGFLASAGERDGDRKLVWQVPHEKRWALGGLIAILAVGVAWISVIQPIRAEYHEQVARIAAFYGHFEKAAIHGMKSIETNPYQLEVRFLQAGIYANWAEAAEKQYPHQSQQLRRLAIAECQELRKLAPDYDTVVIRLAFLLAQEGRFPEAQELAEWVLARRPNEKDAKRLLGLLEKKEIWAPQNIRNTPEDGS